MAHSPSLCAILCMAVGATQIGEDTLSPRTVVSGGGCVGERVNGGEKVFGSVRERI